MALLGPLHRRVKYSRASRVLDSPPVRWIRSWIVPGMAATDVLNVLDTLAARGVSCWLAGGWGVDALVGHQTRKHWDVDVAIERTDFERAVAALEGDGFVVSSEESVPAWMPRIVVMRGAHRQLVDLLVVDVPEPAPSDETRPDSMRFRYGDDSFAEGMLDGRAVRCLSVPVQILFHTGYPPRATDRHDVRVLTTHFGLPTPDGYS